MILLITSLTWLFWPQYEVCKISKFGWDRYIHIEEWQTDTHISSWKPSPPARIQTWWIEPQRYKDSDGDWHTKYVTKYKYEIEEWHEVDIRQTGGYNQNPIWDTLNGLSSGSGQYNVGQQRESYRHERLTVYLKDKSGNGYEYIERDFDRWKSLEKEQVVFIQMFRWGSVLSIKTGELE